MKVLLINPWQEDVLPAPSIGYLQAAIRKLRPEVQVEASDLLGAIEKLKRTTYDLVGVSFHSFSVQHARYIRDLVKDGRLICGGHHPSALPQQMLDIGYDQVVIGEGEDAIISIIDGNTDTIVQNCNKYFNGEFPFPDYSGMHFEGSMGINIISSRGCPYSCTFCGSTHFWKHKYRMRSAEDVLNEVEQRKVEGFTTWIFEDDNFTAHRKRAFEICAGLDGRFLWKGVARAEDMDEELCKELYRAGCREVYLGIESLSQDVLDRCNKHTTVEKMMRGIQTAERNGIRTFCLFIVGLPGDTRQDIELTRNRRRTLRISKIGVNIAWILPNTEIYQKAKEQGFDEAVYLTDGVPFYTYEQRLGTLQFWSRLVRL